MRSSSRTYFERHKPKLFLVAFSLLFLVTAGYFLVSPGKCTCAEGVTQPAQVVEDDSFSSLPEEESLPEEIQESLSEEESLPTAADPVSREKPASCTLVFESYDPSPLEAKWKENIDTWKNEVCARTIKDKDSMEIWSEKAAQVMKKGTGAFDSFPPEIFSKMTWENPCTGEKIVEYIEPLAGLTRHPLAVCIEDTRENLLSREFLVLRHGTFYEKPPKAFYFDLGASTFLTGPGGASQIWITESFKRAGIEFDQIFAWEARGFDSNKIWAEIPAELKPKYHWMNIKANSDPTSSDNPWNYIKAVATEADFVVVKLDIDVVPVEREFMDQLLADESLRSLVDEMFFEHHVNVPEMHRYWSSSFENIKKVDSLSDTYRIYQELRHLGVRFHSWP